MFNLSESDTKEIDLTPEFVLKSDQDFESIKSLLEYSSGRGFKFIITGGYATDAHLGGKISRAHGDVDCVVFKKDVPSQSVLDEVQEILSSEVTKWDFSNRKPNKLDCRENRTDIPFNQRRRIEIKISDEDFDENKYESKRLLNSHGESLNLKVINFYLLVSEKIHKFYELKDGVDTTKDRETSLTDVIDLARLIKIESFDKKRLLDYVKIEEYEYVHTLLGSLSSKVSKYLI